MKKLYLVVVCLCGCLAARSANYYVDAANGNNANSGLGTTQAKATIQAAANLTNPGDTVFIMNGTYTSTGTVLNITVSGTALAPIVYTNYPGSTPRLAASVSTYNIVYVNPGVNYITINGLEIVGYGVNLSLATDTTAAQATESCPVIGSPATSSTFVVKYNGNGIVVNTKTATAGCHHIRVSNNKVHDCTAAGIAFVMSDYITVENNTVYNNSWYTIYGSSGISFNNSYNYDTNTVTYRNLVRNNVCYGNRLYSPWVAVCKITDGNGIILDIPLADYNGRTLVANNLCYNNGGSGVHTLQMNHTDMIHNTSYYNSASPEIDGGALYAYNANDVRFYNNIMVARPNKRVSGSGNTTSLVYDYNLYYGGSKVDWVGAHSLIQDPKFVNASTDPALADFHLQAGSFAVNTGDNAHTYPLDRDGGIRPAGQAVDMGAYESVYTGNLNGCDADLSKIIGNGNGTGEPGAIFYGPYDTKPGTNNQQSRHAFIYPGSLLTGSGLPANGLLTHLQFRRSVQVSGTVTTPSTQAVTDNSIIKIYLRNEGTDNLGSANFDWNTILPAAANPAVLVYAGEAAPLVGNAGGWRTVRFQIPFQYAGSHLGVYVEYLQKGSITSATDINWIYDNGGSQPLYNITTYPNQLYGSKTASASGSALVSASLAGNNERRPVIALGYCAMASLPVTIRQFNAVKRSGSVYVSWLVSNETNSAGFEVQRSRDGTSFEPVGFIGSVTAGANGSAANRYDFTDAHPFNGTGFYRLVQKDKDGKLTYSAIVPVNSPGNQPVLLGIYPNPVKSAVNAWVNIAGVSAAATVSIRDMRGRTISRSTRQLRQGYNSIDMDVAALPVSTYLFVVELSSGERLVSRFVKM